jgi:hypothetical protein
MASLAMGYNEIGGFLFLNISKARTNGFFLIQRITQH